jgi:hypothetical protein
MRVPCKSRITCPRTIPHRNPKPTDTRTDTTSSPPIGDMGWPVRVREGGSKAQGGPFCAMPMRQQGVKAYRGTVLGARLFREALVGLPVVRVLRVEVVGRAVCLQSLPEVVLALRTGAEVVVRRCIIQVKAQCLARLNAVSASRFLPSQSA